MSEQLPYYLLMDSKVKITEFEEKILLELIKVDRFITKEQIAQKLKISKKTSLDRDIYNLLSKQLIRRIPKDLPFPKSWEQYLKIGDMPKRTPKYKHNLRQVWKRLNSAITVEYRDIKNARFKTMQNATKKLNRVNEGLRRYIDLIFILRKAEKMGKKIIKI